MRPILFLLSLVAIAVMIIAATQLFLDKRDNPELYRFKIGSYEAYQQTIRPVYNAGDFYIVEITEPLKIDLSFEQFQADVEKHNILVNEHYRDFISMKFYLLLLSLAFYMGVRMVDLEIENSQLRKKIS